MMNLKKLNKAYMRLYLLSFIGITMVFIVVGFTMIRSVREYAYKGMMNDSLNTAKGYSYTISKTIEAHEVVNELVEQKISAAGNAIRNMGDMRDIDLLAVVKDLEVDSIDIYNSRGVVIDSFSPQNIGWKVYAGHPVNDFYKGDEESMISGVRVNTISGKEFKYGYFRLAGGGFIQVGVSAEHISSFVNNLEIVDSINKIKSENNHLYLTFVDLENNITASSEKDLLGTSITDPAVRLILNNNEERGILTTAGDEEIYQVFVPIFHEDVKIGTLSIGQSTASTDAIVARLSAIGLVILLSVYGAFLILMTTTHRKSKELMTLAYFDQLTGLPNHLYLKELLQDKVSSSQDKKKAMILVNCNNFKIINMLIGYEYGDEVLREIGRKIASLSNEKIQVFRFTADRFLVYVEDYLDREELVTLTEEITTLFKQPFRVKDSIKYLNIQFGITEFTELTKTFEQLLKEVTVSLGSITALEKVNYAFFSHYTGRKLQMEESIESDLRNVIEDVSDNTFHLVYQPMVSLKDGSIGGFEALSRFVSRKYGEVPPMKFIEIAEKKNLIVPLGNMIFTKACRFARKLQDKGFDDIRVTVNISGLQLLQEDFVENILGIMNSEGVRGSGIELEITESVLMENFEHINKKLSQLKSFDIKIALDDFGTGYSSLSRLKGLHADTLKIDKTFIDPIIFGDTSSFITRDIISMAHRMGLNVVAEGVELESQLDYLMQYDCDYVQGYICSKPLKEDAASLLLIASPYTTWPRIMERRFPETKLENYLS